RDAPPDGRLDLAAPRRAVASAQPHPAREAGAVLLSLAPGANAPIDTLADLDAYLGAVAGAGFEAVSLALDQLLGEPAAAARLVRRHGLRCTDVLALRVTRDEDATLATAAATRAAAAALGAPYALAFTWNP